MTDVDRARGQVRNPSCRAFQKGKCPPEGVGRLYFAKKTKKRHTSLAILIKTPGERSEPGVGELPEVFGLEEAAHKPFVYGLFEAGMS